MTTIAIRDGVIAADSSAWARDTQIGMARKIVVTSDGAMAIAGDLGLAMAVVRALEGESADLPEVGQGSISVWWVNTQGRVQTLDDPRHGFFDLHGDYFANGNGAAVAMGAMHAGASAIDAVRAACQHDASTSGPVWAWDTTNGLREVPRKGGKKGK